MWIENNLSTRRLRAFLDRAILFNTNIEDIIVKNNTFSVIYTSKDALTDTSTKYLKVYKCL